MVRWMYMAAKAANIPDYGRDGGIIHDEMSIQEDIVISKIGGKVKLVGFVDTGGEGNMVRSLKTKDASMKLATQVVQFIFQGHSGFRFPLCHFPVQCVKGAELYAIVNSIISTLYDFDFNVGFIMQDGGQENRTYTSIMTDVARRYVGHNPVTNTPISICQDYSHNCKKMRNNILKSGIPSKKTKKIIRTIRMSGQEVSWKHWEECVEWDMERLSSGRRIYPKITKSHLRPSDSEKMRNHLAEEMLNTDMLHLMECYQASLSDGSHLNGTVQLLRKTSRIVTLFRDRRHIKTIQDPRLTEAEDLLSWMETWTQAKQDDTFSKQCSHDIQAMLGGLIAVCKRHLLIYPHSSGLIPAMFNSDAIENFFCQQRGLNGNNDHPTYNTYANGINSIVLTQPLKCRARRSNVGQQKALPYRFYTETLPQEKPQVRTDNYLSTIHKICVIHTFMHP